MPKPPAPQLKSALKAETIRQSPFAAIHLEMGFVLSASERIDLIFEGCANAGKKHMEIVGHLKTDHGMGHGHANAVGAYAVKQG